MTKDDLMATYGPHNLYIINAGKVFVNFQRVLKRDWDMILTVVRHKKKELRKG